jgi:hypothetical protein
MVESKYYFNLFTFILFWDHSCVHQSDMVRWGPSFLLSHRARPINSFMLLLDEASAASAGTSVILRGHSSFFKVTCMLNEYVETGAALQSEALGTLSRS